jgi:hypothetical protein
VPVSRVAELDDARLLHRINQINEESCAAIVRDRPDFDASILAGIIEQRRDACQRRRFANMHFHGQSDVARFADRDDRRTTTSRFDDRQDDRQIRMSRFSDRDDRRASALRFDDRQDDREVKPARFASAARFQSNRGIAAPRNARSFGRPRPL